MMKTKRRRKKEDMYLEAIIGFAYSAAQVVAIDAA
jgi:hypothetical protein